jgi:hypothetical protein
MPPVLMVLLENSLLFSMSKIMDFLKNGFV